jgi:hypothetical protein
MTLENPLMLGIILIIVGIATALVAAAILLNRRDQQKETEIVPQQVPASDPEGSQSQSARRAAPSDPIEYAKVTPPAFAPENPGLPPAPVPVQVVDTSTDPVPGQGQPSLPQIAAIRLDPDSGRPVLSIGNRDYTSAAQLRSSPDWYVVKNSLAEIASWVREDPPKVPGRTSAFCFPKSPAAEKKPLNQKPTLPQAVSMVEQINDIIQEKIQLTGQAHLSVRLIENLQGEVKALVGVESYPLDAIPDPGVQALIRDCVAEWESKV